VIGPVELPRSDITEYAYVLWPLVDIAGAQLHPRLGVSYSVLKQQFQPGQQLHPVSFQWRGRDLTAIAERCAG
jgi:2-amino-4-hydroxy-6-hydroxymethyldihydropteridine diphosphokinase